MQCQIELLRNLRTLTCKTSQYDVHDNLFPRQDIRTNRFLLPFKLVISNNLTLEQLESFENGFCVEFVNDDYYNPDFKKFPIHEELKNLIGLDGVVSAIISFRSEHGEPGAENARNAYNHYKNHLEGIGNNPVLTPLSRAVVQGRFQSRKRALEWKCILVNTRGSSNSIRKSHRQVQLFNPAIDYANERVCFDIELVMHFFRSSLLWCTWRNRRVHQEKRINWRSWKILGFEEIFLIILIHYLNTANHTQRWYWGRI